MRTVLRTLFLGLAAASLSPVWAAAGDCGDVVALVQHAKDLGRLTPEQEHYLASWAEGT